MFAPTLAIVTAGVTHAPLLTARIASDKLRELIVGKLSASVIVNVVPLRLIPEIVELKARDKSALLTLWAVCVAAVYVTPWPVIVPERVTVEPTGNA